MTIPNAELKVIQHFASIFSPVKNTYEHGRRHITMQAI